MNWNLGSGNLEPLHNKAELNKCVGKEGKAKTTSQFYRHREHSGFITVLHEITTVIFKCDVNDDFCADKCEESAFSSSLCCSVVSFHTFGSTERLFFSALSFSLSVSHCVTGNICSSYFLYLVRHRAFTISTNTDMHTTLRNA